MGSFYYTSLAVTDWVWLEKLDQDKMVNLSSFLTGASGWFEWTNSVRSCEQSWEDSAPKRRREGTVRSGPVWRGAVRASGGTLRSCEESATSRWRLFDLTGTGSSCSQRGAPFSPPMLDRDSAGGEGGGWYLHGRDILANQIWPNQNPKSHFPFRPFAD